MQFPDLINENRDKLKRLARLRLGNILQGRVDASDVVQEACIDAMKNYDTYRADPKVSPYVWLRFFLCQKIIQLHRTHVKTQARDVRCEVSINRPAGPELESAVLAIDLFDREASPTSEAIRQESIDELVKALDELPDTDRELIALRHFEHLTTREAAELLGISINSVHKRHTRALLKLKKHISG